MGNASLIRQLFQGMNCAVRKVEQGLFLARSKAGFPVICKYCDKHILTPYHEFLDQTVLYRRKTSESIQHNDTFCNSL